MISKEPQSTPSSEASLPLVETSGKRVRAAVRRVALNERDDLREERWDDLPCTD
jgi:hypothetical protein